MADGRRPFVAGTGPGRRAEREAHRPACCCRGRQAAAGCSDDDEGRLRAWPSRHHVADVRCRPVVWVWDAFESECRSPANLFKTPQMAVGDPLRAVLRHAICRRRRSAWLRLIDVEYTTARAATASMAASDGPGAWGRRSSGRLSSWQRSASRRVCSLPRRSPVQYLVPTCGAALVVTDLSEAGGSGGSCAGPCVQDGQYAWNYHYEWFPFRSRRLGPQPRSRSR